MRLYYVRLLILCFQFPYCECIYLSVSVKQKAFLQYKYEKDLSELKFNSKVKI